MANSKCDVCLKTVYPTERATPSLAVHKGCFRCKQCKRQLNIQNSAKSGGEFYCNEHNPDMAEVNRLGSGTGMGNRAEYSGYGGEAKTMASYFEASTFSSKSIRSPPAPKTGAVKSPAPPAHEPATSVESAPAPPEASPAPVPAPASSVPPAQPTRKPSPGLLRRVQTPGTALQPQSFPSPAHGRVASQPLVQPRTPIASFSSPAISYGPYQPIPRLMPAARPTYIAPPQTYVAPPKNMTTWLPSQSTAVSVIPQRPVYPTVPVPRAVVPVYTMRVVRAVQPTVVVPSTQAARPVVCVRPTVTYCAPVRATPVAPVMYTRQAAVATCVRVAAAPVIPICYCRRVAVPCSCAWVGR